MADFTLTNPYIGHGIVTVSGPDEAAVKKLAQSIADAIDFGPHKAPVNIGFPVGAPDGEVLSDKKGIKVTLFKATTEAELNALKPVVGN